MKAEELFDHRQSMGLSKNEIADRLGVPKITYSRWERGIHPPPFDGMLKFALIGLKNEIQAKRNNDTTGIPKPEENNGFVTVSVSSPVGNITINDLPMGSRQNKHPLSQNGPTGFCGTENKQGGSDSMIIAIFNQSGGVGKSTLTRDLGYELSLLNQKVLLIDADPQGTLGTFLGLNPGTLEEGETFWHVISSRKKTPDDQPAISPSNFGMDVGLANRTLVDQEILLTQLHNQARLLSYLRKLKQQYDFILLDCSPKISEITFQILMACDGLLVPVQTEAKSVSAFFEVNYEIAKAQQRRLDFDKPPLEVIGIIPTLHNPRLLLHRHHLNELINNLCPQFGYRVFPPIKDYIAVSEAGTQEMPLKLYDPKCPVNEDLAFIANTIFETAKTSKTETLTNHG